MNIRPSLELPPPPADETQWPWTAPYRPRRPQLPDGCSWPLVSIVTPSFNQGGFIEETIRSVLLQGYPNLEYLIIDGGSTDSTIDVIKKYESWIDYWVSEPDRGQTHAINKGFERARGDIVAWLNSDDTYEPGAIETAVHHMLDRNSAVVYGSANIIDEHGRRSRVVIPPKVTFDSLLRFWVVPESTPPQPAIFFRRHVLEEVGFLDESLRYVMDYELWMRIAKKYSFSYVDAVIANCRMHSQSKTISQNPYFAPERYRVSLGYGRSQGLGYRLPYWKSYVYYKLRVCRFYIWRSIRQQPALKPLVRVVLRLVGDRSVGSGRT